MLERAHRDREQARKGKRTAPAAAANPGTATMDHRAPSLRTTLSVLTGVLTALAIVVVAALLILIARLDRASEILGAAVESGRLAEEAQFDPLLPARSQDPLVERRIEHDMLSKLAEAQTFVTTPEEERALGHAREKVESYLAASRDGAV